MTVLPLGEIFDDLRGWFPPGSLAGAGGETRLPVNCLHVGGSGISVLIDACDPRCYSETGSAGGSIGQSLEEAGISPGGITHILLTHGHHDHFCGVAGPGNEPAFPTARHVLPPQDWAGGTLTPEAQRADGDAADPAPLEMLYRRGLLDFGESAVPLPEEISLIQAPGETEGHCVARISSKSEVLFFLADLFHVRAEIDNPALCPVWADAAALKASRSRILSAMRRDNARFLCSHISGVLSPDLFPDFSTSPCETSA
ncbi:MULTISPECIES: MBL fold metallo-hydrolase [unclassified Phaeobacter]|uniref:MBL fold metallo-hydrolase n=1 Tax=unclassified Phaeobacter TaxID=2621772 RepID=UPI003A8C2CE8